MLEELLGLILLLIEALVLMVVLLTIFITREARRPPRHTAGYAVARGMAVDPGDVGLDFNAWSCVCADGVMLPVWEIAGNRGATRTAVLVHGWGQSRIDMLARLEPWRARFDRLVLYDLRGHGDTEGHLSRLGDREDDDLLALLEQLGDGPVHLIGWSMGASIALAAAAREGPVAARIAGVVSYGAYLDFHTALRGRLRSAGLPTRPMTDLAMAWFRLRGLRLPPLSLDGVRCPVLLVHGAADGVVPIDHAHTIAASLKEVTLIEIPDGGHGDVYLADQEAHDEALDVFDTSTA